MKYVYFEPTTGFNDILFCILKICNWCKIHNRVLIVNGKKSLYKVDFYNYFDIPGVLLNPYILKDFQGTIYPPELQGKMNDILDNKIRFYSGKHDSFYDHKKLELVDTDADVVIYAYADGGDALPVFKQIRYKPFLLNIMKERHQKLKKPYLCIHIRNTDYKCDYQKYFYKNEKKIRAFKEVYLCTDDVSTLHFYKQMGIPVKNFTTFPNISYESLHSSDIDPHTKMVDLFCDIYIATLSHTLASNSGGGFILLLRSIHDSIKVVDKPIKDKKVMVLKNR
jgi:hypothetical protein